MVGNRTHTWWGAHIHGGLASQQASFGGGPGWIGARGARGAGIWVPHHVFESKVSGIRYQVSCIIQALRKEIKAFEKTHARAVRKVPKVFGTRSRVNS